MRSDFFWIDVGNLATMHACLKVSSKSLSYAWTYIIPKTHNEWSLVLTTIFWTSQLPTNILTFWRNSLNILWNGLFRDKMASSSNSSSSPPSSSVSSIGYYYFFKSSYFKNGTLVVLSILVSFFFIWYKMFVGNNATLWCNLISMRNFSIILIISDL